MCAVHGLFLSVDLFLLFHWQFWNCCHLFPLCMNFFFPCVTTSVSFVYQLHFSHLQSCNWILEFCRLFFLETAKVKLLDEQFWPSFALNFPQLLSKFEVLGRSIICALKFQILINVFFFFRLARNDFVFYLYSFTVTATWFLFRIRIFAIRKCFWIFIQLCF